MEATYVTKFSSSHVKKKKAKETDELNFNSIFYFNSMETWVQSLGQEDPLEKGMATHSSLLAWEIP